MYPVKLDFERVTQRIEKLLKNGHDAEALVTSMFTLEKLMKRTLRRAIVARGFSIEHAEKILYRSGFDDLVAKWDVFEKGHRRLPEILGDYWRPIKRSKTMRNDLVHGNKVFDLSECRSKAKEVLAALRQLHRFGLDQYGVDTWQKRPRKRAKLPWRP